MSRNDNMCYAYHGGNSAVFKFPYSYSRFELSRLKITVLISVDFLPDSSNEAMVLDLLSDNKSGTIFVLRFKNPYIYDFSQTSNSFSLGAIKNDQVELGGRFSISLLPDKAFKVEALFSTI